MRLSAIIIDIKKELKKASILSIAIRIVNTVVTEIRSNFYLVWKWNHFIGHQQRIIIEFF